MLEPLVTVLVDGDGRMREDGVLQAVAGREPAYAPFASTLSHAGSIYRRELAALDTLWRLGMLGNGGTTDTEEGMS